MRSLVALRFLVVAVALLFGCRSEPAPAPPRSAGSATTSSTGDTSTGDLGSAVPASASSQTGSASDPWAVERAPSPDDPPSARERHKLADEACPTVTGPYFYRIEKRGKVSYILGTRHLGVPLSKFPPSVKAAITSSKLAVFEVAPGDDSDLPEQKVMLRDELGPDLWKHYQELVGSQMAQALESTAPSVAVLSMMAMYEDLSATLDSEIERLAQASHIPTQGLETAEFQDRLLNKILDVRMLRASVEQTKDRAELAKESHDDLAEYCAGTDDKPGMDDDMRAEMLASGYSEAELAKIDDEMVYARNASWIPKLDKILADGNAFIAVGADHLTGPKGVVALLEKRGYKLTRITK